MSIILRQNENLIKVARMHTVFLLPSLLTWPILIIVAVLIRYLVNFDFFGYWGVISACLIATAVLVILYKFYIWKMNALVITNQRIVENKQKGIFSIEVTELLFRDITQITYVKKGLSASLSDFGDIVIRTISEGEIVFEKIADPDKIVEIINEIRRGELGVSQPNV